MILTFQNSDSFGQLIEKESVRFTFEAPGWYLLMVLIGLAIMLFWVFLQFKQRKNAYRKVAIDDLQAIAKKGYDHQLIKEVNIIIKRIVIAHSGKDRIASLGGDKWIDYLNDQCKEASFHKGDDLLFEKAVYEEASLNEAEVKDLLDRSISWIKEHEVKWI